MKQLVVTFFLAAVVSTGLYAQTSDAKADSVFLKYYTATGGKALWDSVQTYTLKQAYRAGTANDFDLDIKASLPSQAMVKVRTILKRDFIYGIKATDGWLKIPIGSRDKVTQYQTSNLSDKEREIMRRELTDILIPFDDYTTKGYIATVVGTEQINGATATQVELEGKGVKYNLYFDAKTGLLLREKLTLATGEIQTRDHAKYEKSKYGLSYPSETTYVSSIDKKPMKVTTLTDFNVKFAEDPFVK
ncbi:putative salt-induced outer membrane protein [Runella defluvii]|uniref:Putative salt-induced outer membrane protein n=1 Tax=Runella defluvii TaxID=370973 RepID=A0A7W6ER48_9BACT|nr:hypothetical protein [Runella defluvii]MBB3839280.1 putative salt-induced outer membrane protein [Runella defluvii]